MKADCRCVACFRQVFRRPLVPLSCSPTFLKYFYFYSFTIPHIHSLPLFFTSHLIMHPLTLLQDTYYGVRDKMHIIADQHANLGRTVDSSIIQHLQKLRIEINAHIKASVNPHVCGYCNDRKLFYTSIIIQLWFRSPLFSLPPPTDCFGED